MQKGEAGREDKHRHPNWKGPAPHHRQIMEDNTEAMLLLVLPSLLSSKPHIQTHPSVLETEKKNKSNDTPRLLIKQRKAALGVVDGETSQVKKFAWFQIPRLPLPSTETLGKSLKPSVPRFPHC